MIHTLLAIALAVFIVWIVLVLIAHIGGGLLNLLWIVIVIALIWWLVSFITGRGHRTL